MDVGLGKGDKAAPLRRTGEPESMSWSESEHETMVSLTASRTELGFTLIRTVQVDPVHTGCPPLDALYQYWDQRREGCSMPGIASVDVANIPENKGRLHLLEVNGLGSYRYRVYGARVTNPDRRDMTGLTTQDYDDRQFGDMVTRHLSEAHEAARPICYHIKGSWSLFPYEYLRVILPLSDDGAEPQMLLVGTHRIEVPRQLWRDISGKWLAASPTNHATRGTRRSR